ncbi:hypothetical protein [Paenibacillus sp. URB8-2]|uniref:hypothetical protein n=1 Tax=Paenibacillus sp. URB8-2 TaxID=2741301 RepID=UPI0015BEDDB2|nr:hypothetical protein [Paenibacillus sp. URB8-2]BCG61468.1 hypothetical protein PUR_48930 [Paenibacillus sp. URB8-2]
MLCSEPLGQIAGSGRWESADGAGAGSLGRDTARLPRLGGGTGRSQARWGGMRTGARDPDECRRR